MLNRNIINAGYNLQASSDSKNKLLVGFDTGHVNDSHAFASMATQTKDLQQFAQDVFFSFHQRECKSTLSFYSSERVFGNLLPEAVIMRILTNSLLISFDTGDVFTSIDDPSVCFAPSAFLPDGAYFAVTGGIAPKPESGSASFARMVVPGIVCVHALSGRTGVVIALLMIRKTGNREKPRNRVLTALLGKCRR